MPAGQQCPILGRGNVPREGARERLPLSPRQVPAEQCEPGVQMVSSKRSPKSKRGLMWNYLTFGSLCGPHRRVEPDGAGDVARGPLGLQPRLDHRTGRWKLWEGLNYYLTSQIKMAR